MSLLYRMGTGNGSGGDLKPFIVEFTCSSGFIGKTVTMEFQGTPHAGETVDNVSGTVVSDGTKGVLTLYPMHDGLWKYYATSDLSGYQEGTITLEKWGNYPVELKDTPNGATVTPTDDVQTWLHCANIWNKSYTTISEVIADTTSLNTLIADENANDYLVRSTSFATDMCADETAMTYIGLNDYCANKLLANSTWFEAICNSPYFKKVLNVEVPAMKDNTTRADGVTPSGVCSNSDGSSNAYLAFDGQSTESDIINQVGAYFQYKFVKPVRVNKVITNGLAPEKYRIQASKNGTTDWVNLSDEIIGNRSEQKFNVSNNEYYNYYRIYESTKITSNTYTWVYHIQFYGREA